MTTTPTRRAHPIETQEEGSLAMQTASRASLLLETILEHSTGKGSRIHGPTHWAGVAAAGLTLCELTPEADRRIVLYFSMLHDSMRETDGYDPDHGARAAELARRLYESADLKLDAGQLAKLEEALTYHDKGRTSADPTIGACWDSDRLNLHRVGITPKASLLSTSAGRHLSNHAGRVFSMLEFNWEAIFGSYAAENTVYLRFGELPPDGCSAVPILGLRECGVSAYPGSKLADGTYVLDFQRCLLGIDTRFLAWILKQARPLYLVEGRPAGVGGMGEPVLEGARIVAEVSPHSVDVLPDRPRFKSLIEAWRVKREGGDPDPAVFLPAKEPDERRMVPFGAWELVEDRKRRLLDKWGLLKDYDEMTAQREKEAQQRREAEAEQSVWTMASIEAQRERWEEKLWM